MLPRTLLKNMALKLPTLHEGSQEEYYTTNSLDAVIIEKALKEQEIPYECFDEEDIPDGAPQCFYLGGRAIFHDAVCFKSKVKNFDEFLAEITENGLGAYEDFEEDIE